MPAEFSRFRLRSSEILLIFYFSFLAAITPFFADRPLADSRLLWLALQVTILICLLVWAQARWERPAYAIARDWVPLGLALTAYRALDWFSPAHYTLILERSWIPWDRTILGAWGVTRWIDSTVLLPSYLEFCYLLTSAAGVVGLIVLYAYKQRERANEFIFIYLLGLLLAYMIIPWFPSQPPRIIFPTIEMPHTGTALRQLNVNVLGKTGIHSGVFPSAHVSSVFGAAWGMFLALPRRKIVGWLFLVYAVSVAVATVYGRYHFVVDAVAGFGVSLIAGLIAIVYSRKFAVRIGSADDDEKSI